MCAGAEHMRAGGERLPHPPCAGLHWQPLLTAAAAVHTRSVPHYTTAAAVHTRSVSHCSCCCTHQVSPTLHCSSFCTHRVSLSLTLQQLLYTLGWSHTAAAAAHRGSVSRYTAAAAAHTGLVSHCRRWCTH